jgi:hypothetical protein
MGPASLSAIGNDTLGHPLASSTCVVNTGFGLDNCSHAPADSMGPASLSAIGNDTLGHPLASSDCAAITGLGRSNYSLSLIGTLRAVSKYTPSVKALNLTLVLP